MSSVTSRSPRSCHPPNGCKIASCVHSMDGWQEPERVHSAHRAVKPAPHRSPVHRELRAQNGFVGCNGPAIGPTFCDDDPQTDRERVPPSLASQCRSQAPPAIGRTHQVVDVHELGLQLDHEEDPSTRVPRKDIDHATFAVDRERYFGLGDPAIKTRHEDGHRFVHRGMTDVDQTTEVTTLPVHDGIEPGVQRGGHSPNRADRDRREPAVFDPTDDRPRHLSLGGEIVLAPSLADPDRAERGPGLLIVHGTSVATCPYPPRTSRSRACRARVRRGIWAVLLARRETGTRQTATGRPVVRIRSYPGRQTDRRHMQRASLAIRPAGAR